MTTPKLVNPTETVIVPSFSVAVSPVKSVQATNLDATQTVDVQLYGAIGTEPLALLSIGSLLGIGPEGTALAQGINTESLSQLEVRGVASGAGALVRVEIA